MPLSRKSSQPRKVVLPGTAPDLPKSAGTDLQDWFNAYKDSVAGDKETIEAAFADQDKRVKSLEALIESLSSRLESLSSGSGSGITVVRDGNVAPDAAIKESKLLLSYATHPSKNDPTDGQKAALAGTKGSPGKDNRYVTEQDPRLQYYDAVPVGTILPFVGETPPAGYLLCDGSAVNRNTYFRLFAILNASGLPYGSGDGAYTFNLPDGRGRALIGAGTGSGLTARVIGATGGAETVTLTAAQSGLPEHSHTAPWRDNSCASGSDNPTGTMTDAPDQNIATSTAGPTNAAESHENMPPFLAVNWIIKV